MLPLDRIEKPVVLFVIPGEGQGSSMVFARRQAETLGLRDAARVECFYLRSRTSLRVLWQEARRFRTICLQIQPDIVHAHFGTVTALFTTLLTRRTPVLITFRGSDLNPVPTAHGLRAWLGRLFSQVAALGATRIFCVSRGLKNRLWWRRSRTAVLPSGVDTAVFRPLPRAECRDTLGWNHEDPVVLFNAGHDPRNKRLDLAQAAFVLLQAELPQARMEVLRGGMTPERMPLLMNAADCLLVTSDAEGSPTVVQEAIATNLPVVSVDVGDVAERLAGIAQTHVVERNPKALATAMLSTLRAGIRSNSRERAEEVCSRRIADELAQVYREVTTQSLGRKDGRWSITLFSRLSRS
jgi:teichuronic acid biosynthesis glycosyltransferase TuaC